MYSESESESESLLHSWENDFFIEACENNNYKIVRKSIQSG
jgi:hypothetical protein